MFTLFRRRASETAGAPASRAEHARAEWASLPPLERTTGELELTAPSSRFLQQLTGRRGLDLALAPLGHDVRLEAPAGTAMGIARAIETSAPGGVPLDVRPKRRRNLLRRRTERIAPGIAPGVLRESAPAELPMDLEPTPPEHGESADAPVSGPPPAAPQTPISRAPVVARAAEPRAARTEAVEMIPGREAQEPESPADEPGLPADEHVDEPAVQRSPHPPAAAPVRMLPAVPAEPRQRSLLVAPAASAAPEAAASENVRPNVAHGRPEASTESPEVSVPPVRTPTRVVRRRAGLGAPLPSPATRVGYAANEPPEVRERAAVMRHESPEVPEPADPVRDESPDAPESGAAVRDASPEVPEPAVTENVEREALEGPSQVTAPRRVESTGEPTSDADEAPAPSQTQVPLIGAARIAGLRAPKVAPDVAAPTAVAPPREVQRSPSVSAADEIGPTPTGASAALPRAAAEGVAASALRSALHGSEAAETAPEPRPSEDAVTEAAGYTADPAGPVLASPPRVHETTTDLPTPALGEPSVQRSVTPEATSEVADPPGRVAPTVGHATVATPPPPVEFAAALDPPEEPRGPAVAPPAFDPVAALPRPIQRVPADERRERAADARAVVARRAAPSEEPPVSGATPILVPDERVLPPASAPLVASQPMARLARDAAAGRVFDPTASIELAPFESAVQRPAIDVPDHEGDGTLAASTPPAVSTFARPLRAPFAVAAPTTAAPMPPLPLMRAPADKRPITHEPIAAPLARFTAEAESVALEPPPREPAPASVARSVEPVQREVTPAAAPAAPAGSQSPQSLDELAGRLYDRIRARIRDELLIDRERAGLLTDVR